MYDKIKNLCMNFETQQELISEERKSILKSIARAVEHDIALRGNAQLIFICTHNSRRSHIGQVWASTLAQFYGWSKEVSAYSGGTEVTAFHPNAIQGLEDLGFKINLESEGKNPLYKVSHGEGLYTICYSKLYDAEANPKSDSIAIMTCSEADENCPYVPGATSRFATPYEDPKLYDGTATQDEAYRQCIVKIGNEMAYMFSQVRLKENNTDRS